MNAALQAGAVFSRAIAPQQFDLQLVREVPITPEQAFEGWTVPETLMQWFCPKPWQVVECEIDLQAGGVFANVMQSPDGTRMPRNEGSFLLVEAPHRLIWTNLLGPGFRPARPLLPGQGFGFLCELRFDPLPGGGRYQAVCPGCAWHIITERENDAVRAFYPQGIHTTIAQGLGCTASPVRGDSVSC